MVITKNLARLGRNYIETGTYIEKYFPDHRVRYIAILDRVDNFSDSVSNDFVPIKSVFNEKHCKDTSIAVKKTKRKINNFCHDTDYEKANGSCCWSFLYLIITAIYTNYSNRL